MGTEDKIERWMDEALKQYGRAEAGPGFESRVLARVRERGSALRSRQWLAWGFSVAVLATVVLAAIWIAYKPSLTRHQAQSRSGAATTRAANQPSQPMLPAGAARTASARRDTPLATAGKRSIAEPRATESVKLDQFPSPAPLSEQEQMLARYVSQHRQQAVMVARAQTDWLDQERREEQGPKMSNQDSVTDEKR